MLIAGNWKMNGALPGALSEFDAMVARAGEVPAGVSLLVCPPATLLPRLADKAAGSAIALGAQDCHAAQSGAHTGDLSAEMLADAGATAIIVGHSERRTDHGETNAMVAEKARAAQRAGLTAIVCVGETESERKAGEADAIVAHQIDASLPLDLDGARLVLAYEPVWAIGTGLTPSIGDIAAMHAHIRRLLDERFSGAAIKALYGGSVKPVNAKEILAVDHVDGALVGGASLKAGDFLGIALAA